MVISKITVVSTTLYNPQEPLGGSEEEGFKKVFQYAIETTVKGASCARGGRWVVGVAKRERRK